MSNYDTEGINIFEHSYDSNNDEFMVVSTRYKNSDITIVHLTKNKWGFWKIKNSQKNKDIETDVLSYKWLIHAGAKQFNYELNPYFEKELHVLYYGTNALKLVKFKPGEIPENVTINIQQAGNVYYIHLISFADLELLNSIDIPEILLENAIIGSE
jgi:hypothetical protein